jgi:TusA-related sulfurtransferase
MENDCKKIMARGLKPPAPLLLVKNELKSIHPKRIRVIVSSKEAVDQLVEYFESRKAETEIDTVGNDYHVVVDLSSFKEGN